MQRGTINFQKQGTFHLPKDMARLSDEKVDELEGSRETLLSKEKENEVPALSGTPVDQKKYESFFLSPLFACASFCLLRLKMLFGAEMLTIALFYPASPMQAIRDFAILFLWAAGIISDVGGDARENYDD